MDIVRLTGALDTSKDVMDRCAMLTVIGRRRDGIDVKGLEEWKHQRMAQDSSTHIATRCIHVPTMWADRRPAAYRSHHPQAIDW